MWARCPRLAELELRPPADDVDPVLDEQPEQLLQRQRPRPAVDQGQHDDAEGVLQRRELEELVEDDVGVLPLLDLHDDPDRLLAVALVLTMSVTPVIRSALTSSASFLSSGSLVSW